jgi:glutaredoxin
MEKHIPYILYVRTGCPFCARVLAVFKELGVMFEERNISDIGVSEELIARGGKRQAPYLVDTTTGEEMYESDDIIAHVRAKHA